MKLPSRKTLGTIGAAIIAGGIWLYQEYGEQFLNQNQAPQSSSESGSRTSVPPHIAPATRAANASLIEGKCTHVVDGDTIHVKDQGGKQIKVRILGIDTMETHNLEKAEKQAGYLRTTGKRVLEWGNQAKATAKDLLENESVTLILPLGKEQYDPYMRLLAYVEVGGKDYGEIMLRSGLAEARRDDAHARRPFYRKLGEESRKAKRGIYGK